MISCCQINIIIIIIGDHLWSASMCIEHLKTLLQKNIDFSKIWEKSPVVKVGEVVWECWRGCCVKPGLQLSLHKLSFLLFLNLFYNLLSLLDIIKEAVTSISMTNKQIKSWKITFLANLSLIFVYIESDIHLISINTFWK